ncbi:MAG TPA: acetate kinase [Terriglobales bacterium]|nr:acetate kinase [Terriglobales bacterium]
MKILVLNSGSSSQKSALFELEGASGAEPCLPAWEGKIDWRGSSASLEVRSAGGGKISEAVEEEDRERATERMLATLWSGKTRVLTDPSEIDAAGHRIVHGGALLQAPTRITAQVKSAIASVAEFAPLHNCAELAGIGMLERLLGGVPQIAVFDTAFHRTLPGAASYYPGPYEWYGQGIRRYGFHGINHEYCAQRAAAMLGAELSRKLVTCHLGNGCSLAAIQDGKSVDTTMGFTPIEGLMMGTRSGSVDPGILTYLLREKKATGQELDDLLNTKSGLLGISGISGDMRQIAGAVASGNARAKLAFDMFVHRLRAGISAMAASLGGIDALVFTAGIGENSPQVRATTCSGLGFLGMKLEEKKNANPAGDCEISASESRVRVLVIRAQEDWAIAQSCWRVMRGA